MSVRYCPRCFAFSREEGQACPRCGASLGGSRPESSEQPNGARTAYRASATASTPAPTEPSQPSRPPARERQARDALADASSGAGASLGRSPAGASRTRPSARSSAGAQRSGEESGAVATPNEGASLSQASSATVSPGDDKTTPRSPRRQATQDAGPPGPTSERILSTDRAGRESAVQLPPSEPSRIERWLRAGLWVSSRLLVVAFITAFLTQAANVVSERNEAARSRALVNAQLGARKVQRQEQLAKALAELRNLYAELKDPGLAQRWPGGGVNVWRTNWRSRLREAQMAYKLDGQPDFAGSHRAAEEALRNAWLYLSSLERTWTPRGITDEATSLSLQASFSIAEDDLLE